LLSSVDILVRVVAKELHPIEIVFFRNFFSIFVLLPYFLHVGFARLKTARLGYHVVRGGFHAFSMCMWFMAVAFMPLAEATALTFMIPVYASIGAILFLSERSQLGRWLAVAVGFVGMLVIVRPGFTGIGLGAILVTLSAISVAVSKVMTKSLARTDSTPAIVFYMTIILSAFTFVPMLFVWRMPSPTALLWMAAMATLGTLAHLCMTQGYREGDLSAVEPANFVRLIWAASFAFVLFGEIPEIWTWAGAAIIMSGTLFLMRVEARRTPVQ
jgi:drug/metabolite transporter (DMT)-like permease